MDWFKAIIPASEETMSALLAILLFKQVFILALLVIIIVLWKHCWENEGKADVPFTLILTLIWIWMVLDDLPKLVLYLFGG